MRDGSATVRFDRASSFSMDGDLSAAPTSDGWLPRSRRYIPFVLLKLRSCLKQLSASGNLLSRPRRLRVSETVSLGEKRFVSIVEVDGTSFLIGGGASNVTLLTSLGGPVPAKPFQSALQSACEERERA